MTGRPIIFSGPMVRAILSGAKTQTRRVVKQASDHGELAWGVFPARDTGFIAWFGVPMQDGAEFTRREYRDGFPCPYGVPGDRLWVRETTESYWLPHILTGEPTSALCGRYTVDDEPILDPRGFDLGWWYSKPRCPSIHMPRWASRITLEVTGVRVERVQDISEADAIAEGITHHDGLDVGHSGFRYSTDSPVYDTAKAAYAVLWDTINAKRGHGWGVSPWVWVIEFERKEQA